MKKLILSFFILTHLTLFSQISWESAVTIPTPFSKYIRTCKIEHGAAAGDILLTYSDKDHSGNIWMIRSSDLGLTWSIPVIIVKSPKMSNGEYVFNANMIQLEDERLMLVYQHRWDPGTIATKSYTAVCYSSDGGHTWTAEDKTPTVCVWEGRPIQVHNDKDGDGNNDIYIYFTQEVTPTFFPPEDCSQNYSVGRAVAYIVSYDNGKTWNTNTSERFSGRIIHRNYNSEINSQGGMPTMAELPNHRIAVVAEAPKGSSYAFASWVIASDPYDYDFDNIQGNWTSIDYNVNKQNAVTDSNGFILPSSVTLKYDNYVYPNNPANLWKMSTVYGNAPFTCVMPNGLIAYSQNSSQKILVFVANANGRNSVAVANPFGSSNTFYSSIIPISDNMVLCTAQDADANSMIYLCRGQIAKDLTPPTTPGIPRIVKSINNTYTFDWTGSTDNIIVAGYELWGDDKLLATTRWDNSVQVEIQPSSVSQVKVRARDYQGNYSAFSSPLTLISGMNPTSYKSLNVYPTIADRYVHISNSFSNNQVSLYAISMLGVKTLLTVESNSTADLSNITSGCYQLLLTDGDQQYKALIIKR